MKRLLVAITASMWVLLLGSLSYGLGDYQYPFETWAISFSLPLWSIMTVGLWYDTGRLLLGSTVDSKESTAPNWLRGFLFVTWMSIIFTYVVWVHISIQAIQLLVIIPLMGIPLKNWLVKSWEELEIPTSKEFLAITFWAAGSYLTYWILTFCWIVFRVWLFDFTSNGVMFYIR